VQENGPLLAAQLSNLEQAPGAAQNPHVQSFLREGRVRSRATLALAADTVAALRAL
jgi:hypothetical protein